MSSSSLYAPRWTCTGRPDESAAAGRNERGISDRKQGRLGSKASKLRITVAPDGNDDGLTDWWADDPPNSKYSLPRTPISPGALSFSSSPVSPISSLFSSLSSASTVASSVMPTSPLRNSKSLSVLADPAPRPSAKQMFAKIKKFATKSSTSLRKDREQQRNASPVRRPLPAVSFAPSNRSVVSGFALDDEDNADADSFAPYLPLVAQLERDARSIRSAAKSSVVQRTPLSPSSSVASISIRSVSTVSTATEPHTPLTPVTPNFGVRDELSWDTPPTSPDYRASYASSSGIPVQHRSRTSSNPNRSSNVPWINRRPSSFLPQIQKQPVKPAPSLPLPRVPSPNEDSYSEYFVREVRNCEGVRQIRERKEAFLGQTRCERQVIQRRDDGEWTLFLGAGGIEGEAKKKRHSATAEVGGAEEYWAGQKKKNAEGRKRVKSETRPPSSRMAEDWTLSLPLPAPEVQRKTTASRSDRERKSVDRKSVDSDGSITPTETKANPVTEGSTRLSIPSNPSSRSASPAPSTGSRRVESIRRPLPFGPSPPSPSSSSPISPAYALNRFPSTSSVASFTRLPSVVRSTVVSPTTSWRTTGRSGYAPSSGDESIPRPPRTSESIESVSSIATVMPAEKEPVAAPAVILEPPLLWEEEELEPATPKPAFANINLQMTSGNEGGSEYEDEDTDSSSVYYSAQSSISICPSR